ncbi:CAP domain-containing protein [Streptomyces sp. NPDC047023]|uniref:CAP domain-containing protein n=1 Tax=Streptomyces sp. NPDC047023 TaxID=3155139 RepID=UPI0033E34F8B
MRKHRKKNHSKKIAVAAIALGVVAIPTGAMACFGPGGMDWMQAKPSRPDMRPTPGGPLGNPVPGRPMGDLTNRPTEPVISATGAPWPVQPTQEAPPPPEPSQPPTKEPTREPAPRPTATKPAEPDPTKEPTTPPSGPVEEVLSLVNQERAKAGCSAVSINAKLTTAAQKHSEDQAAHRNMSHTGSDGSDVGQRITRAGYQWSTYGENVAYGYSSPAQVMSGWMNSSGHRANILNCNFKEIGIGLAQPGNYWTQVFGTGS